MDQNRFIREFSDAFSLNTSKCKKCGAMPVNKLLDGGYRCPECKHFQLQSN